MNKMKEQTGYADDSYINIKVSEGCTAYSYTINGIEWVDLTDTDSEYCTVKQGDLVRRTFDKLLEDLISQYDIPPFLLDYMYDNNNDDWEQVPCTQDTFIKMVKANKNTEVTYDNHVCECCGDTVTTYRLVVKVNS